MSRSLLAAIVDIFFAVNVPKFGMNQVVKLFKIPPNTLYVYVLLCPTLVTCDKLAKWLNDNGLDNEVAADSGDEVDKTETKELQEAIENKTWIANNARKCPQCQVIIEKNGGCNHISCRNCNHHFCWVCRAVWSNHNYNSYDRVSTRNVLGNELHTARNDLQAVVAEA